MRPAVGASKPVSILMVVDLPAPLGPRKPKNWPGATLRFTSSTATRSPKRRVRFSVEMAGETINFPTLAQQLKPPAEARISVVAQFEKSCVYARRHAELAKHVA